MALPEANRRLCYVAVEAHNTWAQFTRHYLLSLALRPRRTGGSRVAVGAPGIASPADVLTTAMGLLRPTRRPSSSGGWPRRDEPAWHETRALLLCAQALRVSNFADIQAALSIGSRVFDDLPLFRNFYSHRNESSYAAAVRCARQYGIPSAHPTAVLLSHPLGRPWPLIVEWVDDLDVTMDLLCH